MSEFDGLVLYDETDRSDRLPLYFFTGAQPYAELHRLATAAGISWAALCAAVVIPDDEETFFAWLRDYLAEQARS